MLREMHINLHASRRNETTTMAENLSFTSACHGLVFDFGEVVLTEASLVAINCGMSISYSGEITITSLAQITVFME